MANQVDKTLSDTFHFDKLVQFLKDVRGEVAKVTWPSGEEVKGATVVVIIVCIIVAIIIWLVDKIINFGLQAIF